jgi:putative transposase
MYAFCRTHNDLKNLLEGRAMAQSLSNVLLHIVFSTKNRDPLIDEIIAPEMYAYITSIFVSCGSYVHKIGGIEDHVHIFCTLPRTLSISNLVEESKKNSSKWIKTKGQQYTLFAWQKGYAALSVSASLSNAVVSYIENQKEHHKKRTFQDEYREFLRLNAIPYDEKYMWD